jgi:hypothetical protein
MLFSKGKSFVMSGTASENIGNGIGISLAKLVKSLS